MDFRVIDTFAFFDMSSVLWIGLIVAVVVFGAYSAILLWHWKEYSTGRFTTVANMLVYLAVGAGCIITMALSALWYGM